MMGDFDDKIKSFYGGKELSDTKVRNIQRNAMRPRKLRYMFLAPLGAIIFIAVMGKIAYDFVKPAPETDDVARETVTGFTVTVTDSAVSAPVYVKSFKQADGSTVGIPGRGPDLSQAKRLLAKLPDTRNYAGVSVTVAFSVNPDGGVAYASVSNKRWDVSGAAMDEALLQAVRAWVPGAGLAAGEFIIVFGFNPHDSR